MPEAVIASAVPQQRAKPSRQTSMAPASPSGRSPATAEAKNAASCAYRDRNTARRSVRAPTADITPSTCER